LYQTAMYHVELDAIALRKSSMIAPSSGMITNEASLRAYFPAHVDLPIVALE